MKLFERVRAIPDKLGIPQKNLGAELGLTQSKFNGYLNEKSEKNLWEYLPQILEKHPEISRFWLYFGEGEMLGTGRDPSPSDHATHIAELERINHDLEKRLVAYEETIAAQKKALELYEVQLAAQSPIIVGSKITDASGAETVALFTQRETEQETL